MPSTNPQHAPSPDGLELLDVHHRQALFTLGKLAALMSRLKIRGADAEARTMAREIVAFFFTGARGHHQAEERHVFPRLLAGGDPDIVQAVLRLKQDHGWLEEDWMALSPQLQALADGHTGVDPEVLCEGAKVFTALAHDHMTLEESCIYPEAR